MFIRKRGQKKIFIALYVDDGLVAASDKIELDEFLSALKEEFKTTVKPATYFWGLEINRREDGSIKVSQCAYARKILERFGMSDCKGVLTPIIKETVDSGRVSKEENGEEIAFPYRQAVGALMYLMTGTRPDIAYAVGVASRVLENPGRKDITLVKRIFRYIKGTLNYGIIYNSNYRKGIIKGYSDADLGGDELTGRSTTGIVCMYAGGAISWISQRQPSVALSTTEAEVVAASEAGKELVWLKQIFSDLTELKAVPELEVDNEAATRLAQNPEYHRRTKHIKIRHFFIRELVTEGEIVIQKTSSEDQLADMLTKPTANPRLKNISSKIGLNSY